MAVFVDVPCAPTARPGSRVQDFVVVSTWTPKVCKVMAVLAVILGLGLLFYILLGGVGTALLCLSNGKRSCKINPSNPQT